MLENGIVLINTPNRFRNENRYGLEIGDKGEGTQKTNMRGKPIDLTNEKTIPPSIKRNILEGRLKGKGKLTIFGHINESIQDCYVYSMSKSNKHLKEWYAIAKYDAIVEITNLTAFIEALTKCINQINPSVKTCSFQPIEYIDRREQEFEQQTETHPIFVKENRHSWQEEFRLVWDVGGKEIDRIKMNCPKIKNLIRLI